MHLKQISFHLRELQTLYTTLFYYLLITYYYSALDHPLSHLFK